MGRVKGGHLASAHTLTVDDLESDVTRLTPAFTPRVLDEPEFGTVLLTPTDNKDGVVKAGSAGCCIGKDTTTVVVVVC